MARHSQGGMAQHDVAWHSWDGWGGTAQLWHGVAWHSVAGVAWHSMSRRPHVTGRGTHLATGTPSPHLPQDEDEQGQDKDAGQHGQQDDPPRHATGHRRPRVQVDGDGNLGRGGWSGAARQWVGGGPGCWGGQTCVEASFSTRFLMEEVTETLARTISSTEVTARYSCGGGAQDGLSPLRSPGGTRPRPGGARPRPLLPPGRCCSRGAHGPSARRRARSCTAGSGRPGSVRCPGHSPAGWDRMGGISPAKHPTTSQGTPRLSVLE